MLKGFLTKDCNYTTNYMYILYPVKIPKIK